MADEDRINHILNNLLELASGNFDISNFPEVKNDAIDAIDRGVYMLGEQLKADRLKQKQLIFEKEALLKEVHHRVKNNLQVISSLLNLQSYEVDDEDVKNIFQNSQNRVKSMSMIHEMLYKANDFKNINYNIYVEKLVRNLINSNQNDYHNLELKLDVKDIFFNINTSIPLGLIINEIVTNSIKHGFKESETGAISINIDNVSGANYKMEIGDNGSGNSEKWGSQPNSSLGLNLIDILINQLNGSMGMDSTKKGFNYIIHFQEIN